MVMGMAVPKVQALVLALGKVGKVIAKGAWSKISSANCKAPLLPGLLLSVMVNSQVPLGLPISTLSGLSLFMLPV